MNTPPAKSVHSHSAHRSHQIQYNGSLRKRREYVTYPQIVDCKGKTLQACRLALTRNLELAREESVLVITDEPQRQLGILFRDCAREIADNVRLLEIPAPRVNGEEPPLVVAELMKRSDVILIPLSKSLSWTEARRAATASGSRIASMPGITEEIIQRTFAADYGLIRERVNRVCDHLDQADSVRVTTESGTDLRMSIEGRLGRGRRGGIYNEKGAWGNLPCGEAFVAPLEETANGVYVVDTVQAGIDKLTVPIVVTVENGKAVEFAGGREAIRLEKLLRDVGNSQAYNVAELGIGCNDRASIASITLEAEKALGTCHVALGSNCHFGGSVEVDVHLDGVLQAPSIVLDGRRILDRGELVPPV